MHLRFQARVRASELLRIPAEVVGAPRRTVAFWDAPVRSLTSSCAAELCSSSPK